MKLTKKAIDGFAYQGKESTRDVRWDDAIPGFGLRIYPTGRKSFVLSYRYAGRKRFMTLGNYGVFTLEQARTMARKELGSVADGGDPLEDRNKATHGKTMKNLCAEYWKQQGQYKRSSRDDKRHIDKYIIPRMGNRQIKSITRSDIAKLHFDISQHAPIQANRLLSLVNRMFNLAKVWGMASDTAANPAFGIPKNPEKKRDRWVSPDELPKLTQAIDQEANIYARAALWMFLLTGARKSELLASKWEDVDWSRKELRFPETKAGRVHYVPLTSPALTVLKNLSKEDGNPYVFPGHRRGRHLVNISKPWDRVRKAAGVEDVRLHDLRRTVGSWLAQSGNSLHLIGRILNHSNQSTTAVYARFGQDVVADALEAHGKHIMAVAGKAPTTEVVDICQAI